MSTWLKAGPSACCGKKFRNNSYGRKVAPLKHTVEHINRFSNASSIGDISLLNISKLKQSKISKFYKKPQKRKKGIHDKSVSSPGVNTILSDASPEEVYNAERIISEKEKLSIIQEEELLFGPDETILDTTQTERHLPLHDIQPITFSGEDFNSVKDTEDVAISPTVVTYQTERFALQECTPSQDFPNSLLQIEDTLVSPTVVKYGKSTFQECTPLKDSSSSVIDSGYTAISPTVVKYTTRGLEECTPLGSSSNLPRCESLLSESDKQFFFAAETLLDDSEIYISQPVVNMDRRPTSALGSKSNSHNNVNNSDSKTMHNRSTDNANIEPWQLSKNRWSSQKDFLYKDVEAILDEESMNTNLDPPCISSFPNLSYNSQPTKTCFIHIVNDVNYELSETQESPHLCPTTDTKAHSKAVKSLGYGKCVVNKRNTMLSVKGCRKRQVKFISLDATSTLLNGPKSPPQKPSTNNPLTCYHSTQSVSQHPITILQSDKSMLKSVLPEDELPDTKDVVVVKDGFWDV